ncbi:endoplasmic reticulum aminopeptidase 2-like [Protopterus annectens]|uniref:endoplasmic reticulum aminopeptidase 2-like n=1 Tax=Protopterus annectens TaxID=7888 RepID=UPI001CFBE481|nr:endoplasmic reticulum aminopeptidase 2-like [Protopterus annectens]
MATLTRITLLVMLVHLLINCILMSQANEQPSVRNSSSPVATNGQLFPWNKRRLPDWTVPLLYILHIHPNLTTLNFTGSVTIQLLIKKETSFVILHSKGLDINQATLLGENAGSILSGKVLHILEYPEHDQLALQSPEPLLPGMVYSIQINFSSVLAEGFSGFYKSTYKTKDGEVRVIATTDFEPLDARMAFPCFDEPAFKANFLVNILREKHHIALSNMPKIKTIELDDGLVEDYFDASVKMSTYLVAFIVCDFKSVTAITSSGIKVSIYAAPDKWDQTHYALEVAVKLLEFYEQYFNIYYPLPKLDLIAIPDFQSGAMENWGLITYRETALLYDPMTSSASDKLWIMKVIGHELAHQWFGNLVTMEWWDDIWLNEGFARYMEVVSVNGTHPEIQIDDYFLSVCFGAIARDSLVSSRPISNPAETLSQIEEMFDTVSYDKGGCILNMLRDFLTEDVFHSGIVRYLRKYSYGNARNQDLWTSMASTCSEEDFTSGGYCYTASQSRKNAYLYAGEHIDIKEMMNTWTLQKGIPLIIVEHHGKVIRLRQERFLKILQDDPEWISLQAGYVWHVPLTYVTSSSSFTGRYLLTNKSDTIELDREADWVKFNVDMNGYYVVHYEGEGWNALTKLLEKNHTFLSHKDRTHLIHNAFQLVSAGKLTLDQALDLTYYLRHETNRIPLLVGLEYLELFYRMMDRQNISDVATNMKMYILKHFKTVIDNQTWSDEGSISERLLRSSVLELACDFQYFPCVQKAKQLFKEWMESNGTLSLPTDIIKSVYSVGAKDKSGWNYLLEKYKVSMSGAEKYKILSALTRSKDANHLNLLIQLGMQGKVIKTQDVPAILGAIARNPAGQIIAWNFVKENWDKLLATFQSAASTSMRSVLFGTTAHFCSEEKLQEAQIFFTSIDNEESPLRVTQVIMETIQKNIRWMKRNLSTLRSWLSEHL